MDQMQGMAQQIQKMSGVPIQTPSGRGSSGGGAGSSGELDDIKVSSFFISNLY